MPRQDRNQTFDQQGNLISETVVQVPLPVVSAAEMAQVKATLRNSMQTFFPGGVPTGTPTAAQSRNWLIALTVAVRYLAGEMDNE